MNAVAPASQKANVLSHRQVRVLGDWLRDNRAWIESNRPTRGDLAKSATRAVGFSVSKSNVETAAEAADVPLPTRAVPATKGGTVEVSAKLLREIATTVQLLASESPGRPTMAGHEPIRTPLIDSYLSSLFTA